MQFYKIEGLVKIDAQGGTQDGGRQDRFDKANSVAVKSSMFNKKLNKDAFFFVSSVTGDTLTAGIITITPIYAEVITPDYIEALSMSVEEIDIEEVTFKQVRSLLKTADRMGYIDDSEAVLKKYGLDELDDYHNGFEFGENIIPEETPEVVFAKAERLLVKDSLMAEIDRIIKGQKNTRFSGHPVHYLIRTDDHDLRRETCRTLLQPLYDFGRINNKRYCFTDIHSEDRIEYSTFDQLYQSSRGGAVIVRYESERGADSDTASASIRNIEIISNLMKQYRHQVLTILCLPRECTREKDLFYEYLGNISMVEIVEELVTGNAAFEHLKNMARDWGVRTDKALAAGLEPGVSYLTADLRNVFEEWYNNKLKTKIFPQYKEVAAVSASVKVAAPKGSAYEELMNMIGLSEAKKVIERAIKYRKGQVLFADKGMKLDHPSMHMVFSGSPGTAKTTVARLFARIMKDNGLLSVGHLVEVGRGDLVGKYVGWTAKTVQEKFRKAKGGVLFIDEAYSLVDDRSGSYGDEAINTIVQEMENHRDELVVIFAGYTDKMEEFLNKNPGLRSRIAYHVPFPDYSTEELCEIAKLTAAEKGLVLSEGAQDKLAIVFNKARTELDFGNGRYVRNTIEKSRIAQTERLLDMDPDKVTRKDIATICAEDIDMPEIKQTEKRPIGFR